METELTMFDETTQQPNTPKRGAPFQLGARLKTAREAINLSQKDAAGRLHLSPKFIVMMENDSFEDGLPPTFIRGYLRSYARLLNVTENEISAALEQIETHTETVPVAPMPQVLFTTTNKNTERYIRWITYVIALVLITMVGIWWSSHSRYSVSDVPPQASVTTQPVATNLTPTPGVPASNATPATDPTTTAVTSPTATSTTTTQLVTPPAAEQTDAPNAPVAPAIPTLSEQQAAQAPINAIMKAAQPDDSSAPTRKKRHRETQEVVPSLPEPGLEE